MTQTDEERELERQQLIKDTKAILKGRKNDPKSSHVLARKLKGHDEMRWARRLLDVTVAQGIDDHRLRQKIAQTHALVTYKDSQLGRDEALNKALKILGTAFELTKTTDQETLGLTGAIYKRKWEVDADKLQLENALRYYRRGFEIGVKNDQGYTAINAAFIQDLLAHIEECQARDAGIDSITAGARRTDAQKIREEIVDKLAQSLTDQDEAKLTSDDYWLIVTLAEACFGLHLYPDAREWLRKAKGIEGISEWEYLSTAKQLAHLAQIQTDRVLSEKELEASEAWQTVDEFLGHNAAAVRSIFLGKMGLALSGGGFRASLYHIGVLARLAELNLLRHVEVLSCVSGGSIVGAHYYLELRRLLTKEEKRDDEVSRDDYIDIVRRIVDDFLAGIQENPRVSILADPIANLKMLFLPSYSRTQRLGELYEKQIYSRVKDGEGDKERWLNGLYIQPVEKPKGFLPRRDNWSRQTKIPELILNATTLNTGHNWQFTASWMGEPPATINRDVDTNKRYRRMYYGEAPLPYKKIRLGSAVGASSCVPGLFEPLVLPKLYPNTTLRLVDGGVYDNQGAASLLEQDCNVLLVSDATGQMGTEDDPGGGIVKPLLRTNSVMMHRVRDAEYQNLQVRQRGSLLRGLMYVHMKQGLDAENVDWNQCEELQEVTPKRPTIVTPYGIRKDIQERLAGMRTDLDSFSDLEAYALMTSGYRATEIGVTSLVGFPTSEAAAPDWKFLKVEGEMKAIHSDNEAYAKMKQHLDVSSMTFFKIWKLSRPLQITATILGAALVGGLFWAWWSHPGFKPFESLFTILAEQLTVSHIMITLVLLTGGFLLVALVGAGNARHIKHMVKWQDTLSRIGVGLGVGLVGWIFAQLHLRIFDRLFLRKGRIS